MENTRKTRLIKLLLGVLMLLTLFSAARAQFVTGTFGNQITITGYSGTGGAVSIPSTINGLPVTIIDERAFESCLSLTSVTIPNSVLFIGISAFQSCPNLTSLTIGCQTILN